MMGFFPRFFYALLTLLFLLHTRFTLATLGIRVKCIERERKALLMFKQDIQFDHGMLSTWRDEDNEDCCKWKGVQCSNETGHVQILDLHGSDSIYLRGTINITLLTELRDMKHLDLSLNDLSPSDIPKSINSLTNLIYLNLSYSGFVGGIPYQLGKLSNLRYLDLARNYLAGVIPFQLGNLSRLQYLNLGRNYLVGVIPYQLGNLSMLQSLKLDDNFNLTIDDRNNHNGEWLFKLSSLTNLGLSAVRDIGYSHHWLQMIGKLVPKLRELRLSGCGMTYAHNLFLTTSLSNYSSSLDILDLSYNNLNLTMFQWSFNFSFNLQELYLRHCSLSANNLNFLFSHLHFSSLVILDLSYNNLMSIKTLHFSSNLQVLDLNNCSLSSNNLIFTSSNSNLSSLVTLSLSFNQLTSSTIFYWISNFTSNLHELYLHYNLLKGPIPDDFGITMNSLESLYVCNNNLQGEIPTSLGNICTLKSLSLSYNNMSGELSSFIHNSSWCNRHTLQSLNLSGNRITGMLPNLSLFSSVQRVRLSNNQLKGEIPKNIELPPELESLHLDGNYLEGVITTSHFNNLSNLRYLFLSDNSSGLRISTSWVPPSQLQRLDLASCMVGPKFPNWLYKLNNLVALDISKGGISGFVPQWFWPILENIKFINISYNNFVGKIPNLPLKLNYHPEIILMSNNFEGAIPSFFLRASTLYLSNNKFSDLVPLLCGKIEDEGFGVLDISSNQLKGQLPDCWSHLNSLKYVDFSNNNLSGEIPPSIGSLENMEALVLRSNSLIGELPSSLVNCSKLLLLDVSENKLLGPIPSWIGKSLRQLRILSLRINHLYGSLPLHLCHLTHIRLLDLSHNNLSNEIPSCFNNFTIMAQESIDSTNIVYHRYFPNNRFHYGIKNVDFYIKLMWKGVDDLFNRPESLLKSIDLSSNALTGEIPMEFVSLLGLISLNLSRNNLSGKIPIKIGNLKSLEFLDLSRNQLAGTIPSSLAHIDRLTILDLSNNNLFGKIPIGTQLQSFDASRYEGNPNLCGMPLDKKCPEDEMPSPQVFDDEGDDSIFSQEFYLSLGLGFAIGFWEFLGPLLFNHSWRQAYYRLINRVTNRIYVIVAIYMARYLIIKD